MTESAPQMSDSPSRSPSDSGAESQPSSGVLSAGAEKDIILSTEKCELKEEDCYDKLG